MPLAFHAIAHSRCELGEGPLWCERTQTLWWIDAHAAALWQFGPKGTASRPLPKLPAALALLESGELLIAFRRGLAIATGEGASLQWFVMPADLGEERFNDARVDASGRLWIGSMDRALRRPIGALYELQANGHLRCADRGFALSNGIGFSPDAHTLYFAETLERVVWRYRLDPVSRSLSQRQRFAQWPAEAGAPDGLTVDDQGGVWVALFGGARIERLSPDGSLDMALDLPVSQPTSCTFGGPKLQTLYVTTASVGLSETQLASQPLAGATLAIDTAFVGLPEHRLRAVPAALLSSEPIR